MDVTRPLRRNMHNRQLAGVCAGLADYFGLDVTLVRVLYVLALIGLISLTLAIMNALPIPALDGGRLALTLLYRAMRKPLTERTEQLVHGTGFAVLMMLIVLITFVDIDRFF